MFRLSVIASGKHFAPGDIDQGEDAAVGRVMTHLGRHEVTAIYPGVLAECFVIDGDRVATGEPLIGLHPAVGAR